ncbi:exo-alpha-sialidase, partial [Singulisphaera rosea]
AYMREAGPRACIRVAESKDDGITWGTVGDTTLPNPGSGVDAVRLENGHWLMVYNDSKTERSKLAASISEDEGKTWKWTRHLESHRAGRYHYPAVIQGHDGTIHAIYSCFTAAEQPPAKGKPEIFVAKGIKHAAFNEAWVREGD